MPPRDSRRTPNGSPSTPLQHLKATLAACCLASTLASTADPLGPSSRRTSWVISEILPHPAPRSDGRNPEFIEIYNAGLIAEDLHGHRLTGEMEFVFPAGTVVPAGGFLVVAPSPEDVSAAYSLSNVIGGTSGRLNNTSGSLCLLNPAGAELLRVEYGTEAPWPAALAGGHSLVLSRPSFGERDPRAWSASTYIGGSPGLPEPLPAPPARLRLTEILATPAAPALDFIELHNASSQDLPLDGIRLTDDPAKPGFIIPAGTVLPAWGFLAFDESQLGFALDSGGESVFAYHPDETRIIAAVRFPALSTGESFGRYPIGSDDWRPLDPPTPGSSNAPPANRAIVINEIMYHPISGVDEDEYVELFNRHNQPVDLSGWRFTDGIDFEFPSGSSIQPGDYVVIARDPERLRSRHPSLPAATTFGPFSGSLANGGERIALARPRPPSPGPGAVSDDWIVETEVTYDDGGQWDRWADGGGSSLELRDPHSDPRLAANWAASEESGKAPWTTLEATGVLDLGTGAIDQLQLLAQGEGDWLIDDIEVLDASGNNLVSNPTFDAGTAGWVTQGTLSESHWDPVQGAGTPGSLHVHAVGRGDTGANRIRTSLTANLIPGSTATLRARVRWLRGHPEFLLRLRGNYLEAFASLLLPGNPGTPGAVNSRRTDNAGPALRDLVHAPLLPSANQPVVISVRADDPDGVATVRVRYRVDPSQAAAELLLNDDGSDGDETPGDAIFSGTLPAQAQGRLVAFQVLSDDRHTPPASSTFPSSEALIRFGENQPQGTLGTYRIWMTQETFNRWTSRPKLDNTPLPVTFAYGAERVIHSSQSLFAGSPHISPGYSTPNGNLCGYIVKVPEDEPFLGATEIVLDWPGRDATAQQEPTAYWIARELGIPFNHRRFIHLHVNGVTEVSRGSVYEDAQQVNSDLIESWNPDASQGDLFKIEQWFEFSDSLGTSAVIPPRLENFTTAGGAKKLARYRWTWLKRALGDSSANDYRRLFTLVDAANLSDPALYPAQLDAFADIEEWMRVFAVENIVVNLDAWGYDIGKNMYAYKPPTGRWQLYMWDIDWVMLASAQHGYSPTSPLMYRGPAVFGESNRDPVVGRMYQHPTFQRAYWRAIADAVNGPLLPERAGTRLDATHDALVAQGVTRSSGNNLAAPTAVKNWLRQRRDYLLTQLAEVESSFSAAPPPSTLFGTNLLTLRGTAPLAVRDLRANDKSYPVRWNSLSEWQIQVPLVPGDNSIRIQGLDRLGHPVPSASAEYEVRFEGPTDLPESALVINEIQYRPPTDGADFVELLNLSTHTTFDLSSWRIDGLDAVLPHGTILPPNEFLVVTADTQSFAEAYGLSPRTDAVFAGRLNPLGETLTLLRPGPTQDSEVPVDSVAFHGVPPWPTPLPDSASSLQLIDPRQDNRHPANWAAIEVATPKPPQTLIALDHDWRYLQSGNDPALNWMDPGFNDATWPEGPGLLYQESSDLPGPKSTPLTLGRTTYYFRTQFEFQGAPDSFQLGLSTVIDDGAIFYLNGVEIFRLGMPAGPVTPSTFANRTVDNAIQEGAFPIPATHLVNGLNVLAAEVHQVNAGSSDVVFGVALEAVPQPPRAASPDAPNTVPGPLPVLPALWLNELQVFNRSGPVDQAGDHDPWIEIINGGDAPVDLGSCWLAGALNDPSRWSFPAGTVLLPNEFLVVWLDNEIHETTSSELHAPLGLPSPSGWLALLTGTPDRPLVLDAIRYDSLGPDQVIALVPDATPERRWTLATPTPGLSNTSAPPVLQVFINEWMAANQSAFADPADGDYEDWFELFNAGTSTADLTGHFLTDDPAQPNKFPIPAGTVLPAGTFAVVWADEEVEQTTPGGPIHTNFRLSQGGESISLLDAAGNVLDSVHFNALPTDLSGGRWPDGGSLATSTLAVPTPESPNYPPGNLEAARFLSVTLNPAGVLTLSWSAQPGASYRLQATLEFKANGSPWSDVTPALTATTTILTASDPIPNGAAQRFYRVVRLPTSASSASPN